MNVFDILYYNVFSYYKSKYKQKASSIAIGYVSIIQCLLLLLLGVFFSVFFRKMHMVAISKDKAWILFILISGFLFFKNWMQYTGKRRMMVNTKMIKKKKTPYNIWLLWFIPFAVSGLIYILFQAF